ncbi:YihY family inner membrane protein [Flavobacterium sp. NST-5]|uniref:YihY family inner membrane protein n=1 Tax=Flavobacterium ichthyis TaxID=2698827 RepID=A0ABW9Z865_9FLAO|nr:YihY/virulence factor BrkB family protein [Flavobacterium ichthyis]NBL64295.1 YihY family inner membrane protein [Flavobacterium ichthyis]
MTKIIEDKLNKIPVVRSLMRLTQKIKLPWLEGLSFYDLLELYFIGIAKGAFSYRASAIAFSFFMALFPFALFILNLIPVIPIDDLQTDFLKFVEESVPPNTYDAIYKILNDILNNSYKGLLSSGFLLSIFLMANGVNAILGGFEYSRHITVTRGFFRQYAVSIGIAIILAFLLIITVSAIVVLEYIIQTMKSRGIFENINLINIGRFVFLGLMILTATSILFKFGTRQTRKNSFFSIGSIFTTILIILTSFVFGIYVVRFAKYNELYGSIGTLLILMIYIWLNCMILLLGFELNGTINRLKRKKLFN